MPGFWLKPAPGKTQGLGRVGVLLGAPTQGVLEDAKVLEGSWDSRSEWAPKMLLADAGNLLQRNKVIGSLPVRGIAIAGDAGITGDREKH